MVQNKTGKVALCLHMQGCVTPTQHLWRAATWKHSATTWLALCTRIELITAMAACPTRGTNCPERKKRRTNQTHGHETVTVSQTGKRHSKTNAIPGTTGNGYCRACSVQVGGARCQCLLVVGDWLQHHNVPCTPGFVMHLPSSSHIHLCCDTFDCKHSPAVAQLITTVATTNFHGWALQAEGDILPASIILSSLSGSTGLLLYFLSRPGAKAAARAGADSR